MKKLGMICKELSRNRIQDSLKSASSVFVIGFSGISSADMTQLRQALRGSNASMFVVKNTVARLAFKDIGCDALAEQVKGPCALIFAQEEPVAASKALCLFYKDHEKLQLEGGLLQDKILTKKDIEALAKLPSKDVLRQQLVIALNAPIVKLVMALNDNIRKLVCVLGQIKDKKGN
jgi:large subunit ribosomal protein L10